MGVAAAVKKIFAYLLRLKNGTPRGFNIILHTALVCLPFFFIMNKTSSKKVVVQLFSLQNVSRIFFPDLTTFHRKFWKKRDVCEGKIFEQEIKKGIHILSTQCGNSKNVLPLVFSVKSIFANFELLKLPFWQLRGSWFWF